jgi:hypothetical protein
MQLDMNSSRITRLALGTFVLSFVSAFPICLAAFQSPDARLIMQQVYEQTAVRTMQMRASFTIYDGQGHSRKEEFLYRRQNSDTGKKILAVFTAPAEVNGVALLSIQQHGLSAQQYIYGSIALFVGEKGGGRCRSMEKSKSGTFPPRL